MPNLSSPHLSSPQLSSSAAPFDAVTAIAQHNDGRDTRVLAQKYAAMAASPFTFFRATAHLFYEHARDLGLPASPLGWICGDLHVENFGVYKSDNRLEYFDVNDFDEACFGPVSADIVRLGTSILLACAEMSLDDTLSQQMAEAAFAAYLATLRDGKSLWCEHKNSSGAIKALFEQIKTRKRTDFLNTRSVVKRHLRTLICDGKHYLTCNRFDEKPANMVKVFAKMVPRCEGYFEVRDIAFRVAGMGSLGLRRYVILVQGRGDPDKNVMFDMKGSARSAAARLMPGRQPKWPTDALRVVTLQKRLQAMPPSYLTATRISRRDYILRELQPTEDRLNLAALAKHKARALTTLSEAFEQMGRMAASVHFRGAAREGADGPDILIKYGSKGDIKTFLGAAQALKQRNAEDFAAFQAAHAANDARLAATLKE